MATGLMFECEKCGKTFSVTGGSSMKDMDLLKSDEEAGLEQICKRDSEHLGKFVSEIQEHHKECDGGIKYTKQMMLD